MFRPRVIPVLLLKGKGLVKTVQFNKSKYIGDPINAVKIYNEMQADELVFLDITATKENRTTSVDIIKEIADEAFMPFAVGGGINSIESAEQMIRSGAEKVVINSAAYYKPELISEIANRYGSQSVIVSIDVKENFWGKEKIFLKSSNKSLKISPIEHIINMENAGAGEILITSVKKEGMMEGYDLELIKEMSNSVSIPVVANGGAWSIEHLSDAIENGAHAVAGGSMFVYHGPRKGILINYPSKEELKRLELNS